MVLFSSAEALFILRDGSDKSDESDSSVRKILTADSSDGPSVVYVIIYVFHTPSVTQSFLSFPSPVRSVNMQQQRRERQR
ncbi:unnamed protein product [Heligmosomoides polygyrus]|uniref:Secreted protein n=1 Tax=Heligmosomoides polygyrus TaxID=6339 RepID=A0A183G194_HELPZ|nr:unnamed protein product [Heligmosomoides polygyrus]